MPQFIGKSIKGCERIDEDNAWDVDGYVAITYSQAIKLDPSDLLCSLDTTDKGGPRRMAKRWYRWFGRRSAVIALGTPSALRRAGVKASRVAA